MYPQTIISPARMLPAFTFTPEPLLKCYVLGCYEAAVIGRKHKIRGPVDTCTAHDPERIAYGVPFGSAAPPRVGPAFVEPPTGRGQRVRKPTPRPPLAPIGDAINIAGDNRPF